MNDSPYGLTASVWTNTAANPASEAAFLRFADELETGTVFLNRCDYLDPALAWTGVKNSGRGVSLSKFGACSRLFNVAVSIVMGYFADWIYLAVPSWRTSCPQFRVLVRLPRINRLRSTHARQVCTHEDKDRLVSCPSSRSERSIEHSSPPTQS